MFLPQNFDVFSYKNKLTFLIIIRMSYGQSADHWNNYRLFSMIVIEIFQSLKRKVDAKYLKTCNKFVFFYSFSYKHDV